ncbi:hypothetical protein UQW22_13110 [Isoptericola halotolerans]|uniref:hypothetical protein n=1 Tax=Isoptericola halotolerans TaxID=300560 RepID=UPI00388E35E3
MSGHSDDEASWFGGSDDATRATTEAAIRGALGAQRDRLTVLWLDVLSDEPWPADALPALRLAGDRLGRKRRRGISLTLDPRVDEDFEIAQALAPFTIGSTGMSDHGDHLWDVNDTGASTAWRLHPTEERAVRSAISDAGGRPDDLVTLSQHQLRRRELSYGVVGGTAPGTDRWRPPAAWRAYERTVRLRSGAGACGGL